MTQFNIKPEETLFYEKLFSQCDLQKSGKVSGLEAYKLFLKSGIPVEDLQKICEYCGANRLGFFGRSQFYIALKIISLAQAGNSVDENILHINVIPSLPRFDHAVNEEALKTVQKSSELPLSIPPPPNKNHMRTLSGNNILHSVPLTNRYSYSSPVSKAMMHSTVATAVATSKGLGTAWDQFGTKFDSGSSPPINSDALLDKDDDAADEDDNAWDGYTEEDNKGLLNPSIKTDFALFCDKNHVGDNNEYSSSSDHDSSSFSYESDDNDRNADMVFKDNNPTGYTLMEAVEGLATTPALHDSYNVMPMATHEQLDYYTKCFQTMPAVDNGKVYGSDSIDFFQMYNLDEGRLDKILYLTNIAPDSQITVIEFSRALHLITHFKSGFSLPDTLPENLLPVEFEQPDEPFSFDLSDGEIPDLSNNYPLSSLESSYSADGDSSGFDFTDVAVNRGWAQKKSQYLNSNQQDVSSLKSSNKHKNNGKQLSLSGNYQKEKIVTVGRPRPFAKKSLSLPQCVPNIVAPPPPPRSSVTSDQPLKKLSIDKPADPAGDSFSTTSSDSLPKEIDNSNRKISESSKPDITTNVKYSSVQQDTRKQLQNIMRELKSKNHVLLRLNNEMTSELEEMREQRVNLDLQLEYIKQSQIDIQ